MTNDLRGMSPAEASAYTQGLVDAVRNNPPGAAIGEICVIASRITDILAVLQRHGAPVLANDINELRSMVAHAANTARREEASGG